MLRAAALLLLVVGCATPYGAKGLRGGYEDRKLEDGTVEVTFTGNTYTSRAAVEDGARRRAREVCEPHQVVRAETTCADAARRVLGVNDSCEQYAAHLVIRCQ